TLTLFFAISFALTAATSAWADDACRDAVFEPPPAKGFEKKRYRVFLDGLEAGHSAQDHIAVGEVELEGKFAYGDASKDLEEEPVSAWIYDCSEWRLIGEPETDDDGRARVQLDSGILPGPGYYPVTWVVAGDASTVRSVVWVPESN